jgi:hypothetical protein
MLITVKELVEDVHAQDPGFAYKLMSGGGFRGLFDIDSHEWLGWGMADRVNTIRALDTRFGYPVWKLRVAFTDLMASCGYAAAAADKAFFQALDVMTAWLKARSHHLADEPPSY